MQNYEIMFIAKPEEEVSEQVIDVAKKVINSLGGSIAKVDTWGLKRLAYEIAGYDFGIYTLITFAADSALVKELDRKLRINDDVLRHMIIRKGN